jgi:hypothetical protein
MLVRVKIKETGTVAFFRIPDRAATVDGLNVVFAIRDDKGNGPDFAGTLVGENEDEGQLVELSLRHDDVPGFQHQYLVRCKGELIPRWKSEEFEQIGKVWEESLDMRSPSGLSICP